MSRVRIILLVMLALAVGAAALYTVLMPNQPPGPAAAAPAARPVAAPSVSAPAPAPVAPATTAPVASAPKPAPAPAAEPAPANAVLRIESDVPGASVFIDRVYLGTTPLTVPNVTPGSHRINASATGYEGIAENIDVVAGPRDILLKFKEIRLDARVGVTHKHGVGSCVGTLSGTPKGVTYVTTHKDDGFEVPLADIAELELDYLKKNLRLRLKSGRMYNFTETGGGADQLYAFHRDVDKARKQKIGP